MNKSTFGFVQYLLFWGTHLFSKNLHWGVYTHWVWSLLIQKSHDPTQWEPFVGWYEYCVPLWFSFALGLVGLPRFLSSG